MATEEQTYYRDIKHVSDFERNNTGDLNTIAGLENLRQAVIRRLMTYPGSIKHRPTYGVGMKDYQNNINSLPVKRQLALRIADNLEEDSRIQEVTSVSIENEDGTPEHVTITVRVIPIGYTETEIQFQPFGAEVV